MQQVRVNKGDFERLTPTVLEAAKLLLEESDHKYDDGYSADEADIQAFTRNGHEQGHDLYTALDSVGELLAAAEVKHGNEDTTVINLAVREDERNGGLGSLLMKQIAVHAATAGNKNMYVVPLEDEFFKKLGFVASAHELIMVASPIDVIKAVG